MSSRILIVLFVLVSATSSSFSQRTRLWSAWDQLLIRAPDSADDEDLGWRDRLVLHALTPEQADDYYSGRVGEHSLFLGNGQTLGEYLEAKLAPLAGQMVVLPAPCPLFDLEPAEAETELRVRGDLSVQGGSSQGCDIPPAAQAVLLRVRAESELVSGRLKIWAADLPESARPLLRMRERIAETMTVVSLCGDCDELLLRADEPARLEGEVLGYLQPTPPGGGPVAVPFGPRDAFNESVNNNLFGVGAGASLVSGSLNNSFFGADAGASTATADDNSFFGDKAGFSNTASANSFFGQEAGFSNTSGTANAFFGEDAGFSNTTGSSNSFFGENAGFSNTTGDNNAFFGHQAGAASTGSSNSFFGTDAGSFATGNFNAFFGFRAGFSNTSGFFNAFFGADAGEANTTGFNNAFFGLNSGDSNTSGERNSFFGHEAGEINTSGANNTFVGSSAGGSNFVEDNNTSVGAFSGVSSGITNATALGYRARVSQSDSLVLGSIAGVNGGPADVKVGIGTDTPDEALHVHRSDGTAHLLVEETSATTSTRILFSLVNNGGPFFNLVNSANGAQWSFAQNALGSFQFTTLGSGGPEFLIRQDGTVQMGPGTTINFDLRPDGDLFIPNGMVMDASHSSLKKDFETVSSDEILEKVAQLELTSWRYKKGERGRHLGPMAEDFHSLFGLGEDECDGKLVDDRLGDAKIYDPFPQ